MDISTDNKGKIRFFQNSVFHECTKHIKIQAYFVREKFKDGTININHITTKNQPANDFMEVLGGIKFKRFIKALKM